MFPNAPDEVIPSTEAIFKVAPFDKVKVEVGVPPNIVVVEGKISVAPDATESKCKLLIVKEAARITLPDTPVLVITKSPVEVKPVAGVDNGLV